MWANTSTEEAYWLGEEFRKETPLFPRDLYNNLPDLLNDCIIEDASDREQDISLLFSFFADILLAKCCALYGSFFAWIHW